MAETTHIIVIVLRICCGFVHHLKGSPAHIHTPWVTTCTCMSYTCRNTCTCMSYTCRNTCICMSYTCRSTCTCMSYTCRSTCTCMSYTCRSTCTCMSYTCRSTCMYQVRTTAAYLQLQDLVSPGLFLATKA